MTQAVPVPTGVDVGSRSARRSTALTALFAVTSFTGAALMFVVQPLISRLLLPSYGGSPSVWSTSSLFFQVLLLLGYLYAHVSTRSLGARWQPRIHLIVLLLPLAVLPLALPASAAPAESSSPVLWLLRTLLVVIGLPFLVVSTAGPLLQKWYFWTGTYRSQDPYFLFAASNLGSFGGLLAYPLLIEPAMTLRQQRAAWSAGFVVFVLLAACCAVVAQRSRSATAPDDARISVRSVGRRRLLRWAGLAFLPSALMLAVTAHVSTDIAAVPLLWVVPLSIYLASFVAAFTRKSRAVPSAVTRFAVGMGLAAVASAIAPIGGPIELEVAVQMVMLAAVSYAAHVRLAADRPPAEELTTFYLVVAAGGAGGGLLNGLIAPTVFDRVLEYPIVMIAIPVLMYGLRRSTAQNLRWSRGRSLLVDALVVAGFAVVAGAAVTERFDPRPSWAAWLCVVSLAGAVGWRLAKAPRLLVVALVLSFSASLLEDQRGTVDQSRSFFGSYQVRESGDRRVLIHGTTVHGSQFLDSRSFTPTTYYVRTGPLREVFAYKSPQEVAVVGLGTGTIAAYGEAGMNLTFFEIDPEIVRIASDRKLFTYLADSAAKTRIIVGDGRLEMARHEGPKFDLIVLDAFSSDAIPIHLLTREAMRTYADHLAADGVLAVHISNRHLALERVVAAGADALGWKGVRGIGGHGAGSSTSEWVVISPSDSELAQLDERGHWRPLQGERATWTDDHASILTVLK